MPKASGLLDEVESCIAGKGSWLDRLPPEALAELEEVRTRFKAGQYTAKPYQIAAAIIASGKRRGWHLLEDKAMVKWLKS
jgi:hypothetical protein